ncbi:MAG: pteridine-dependent deoxygenase like protein [Lysobacterales bacterium]|nr:MAG: pteridine-dependent deoxygenase like protein [Xanthomonadales bacterium]
MNPAKTQVLEIDGGGLQITQDTAIPHPPNSARLLLGFWFGEAATSAGNQQIARIGLRPIGCAAVFEGWWYHGAVEYSSRLGVRLGECEHYTAAVVQKTETDRTALRELTRQTYIELFTALKVSRHHSVVRIWNYFGDINGGKGDQERYRQFSIGRAEAFEELGCKDEYSPPGTAIGTVCGDTLSVLVLASDSQFQRLENPRQLSAYDYPRQYGPRSPKFSRGGVVSISNHDLFLLSGTAAIVGHESAFPNDSKAQTSETLRNIDALLAKSPLASDPGHSDAVRVYLRNPADYEHIAREVDGSFSSARIQLAYLQGDICRRELLVEIDGAFCRHRSG